MKILGIESTAHTASVSIIDSKGKIWVDKRDMYQTKKGGIIPSEAALHHKKVFPELLKEVLTKINIKEIDLISFSQGPGLAPSLIQGMNFAKELSKKYKIPLIGVNHILAHLLIGHLFTKAKNPVYVFVSGANTQIISLEDKFFRIFGETLDIGMGNAFDKFGRDIGLGFPSGPKIEQLAKKGKYHELPYVVKGMDLSFSGIITKAINDYKKGIKKEDLCFSLQETCFAMLTEVTERALAHTNKNEVLLIGGVGANKRLIEMLNIMCKERKAKFYTVPLEYSGDQATMIAYLGLLQSKNKEYFEDINRLDIKPNWRINQIKINFKF